MDHAAALVEQHRSLAELVASADLATPVPSCPGWTLRDLLVHVGRGHRWAAMIVRERAAGYLDIRSVPDGKAPTDPAAAVDWLGAGSHLLLEAVAATGADTPVWTFTGPQPARWWVWRRLHESVVHGGDAALALGSPYAIGPEVAADGISEWLTLLAARPAQADPAPLDDGVTLHLHATDDGLGAAGEWMIRGTGTGISWEPGHGKGAAAIRGAAPDLLLAALRRLPADDERIQVLGEAAVWRTWLDRTGF